MKFIDFSALPIYIFLLKKKIWNWEDGQTLRMCYIMLPAMPCISKCMWFMFYLFSNFYPYLCSNLFLSRSHTDKQCLAYQ